jgi:hypothetical protein
MKPDRAARLRRIKRDAQECLTRLERLRQEYSTEISDIYKKAGRPSSWIYDFDQDLERDFGGAIFRCERASELAGRELEALGEPLFFPRARKEKPVQPPPALGDYLYDFSRDRVEDDDSVDDDSIANL